jgi:hypothetical protein
MAFRPLGKDRGERVQVTDKRTRERLQRQGVEVRRDNTISKRAYRNELLRSEGWESLSHKERKTQVWRARTPVDKASAEQFRERRDRYATNQGVTKRKASVDMGALYDEAERENWDRSADGALARILSLAGLRPEDADYNVGDTP